MTLYIQTKNGGTITLSENLPIENTYELLFEKVYLNNLEIIDNSHLKEEGSQLPSDRQLKTALRDFAIEWQRAQSELSTSYEELAFWSGFFEKYGKKHGLLEEFRENGII